MTYERELEVAIAAVRQASTLCRSVRTQLSTASLEKDDRSPVTVADFGSQALICRSLRDSFPDDPVIAEEDAAALREPANERVLERVTAEVAAIEAGATKADICRWIDRGNAKRYSERFWTLDPIDGTKGFLRGDQYAVALALLVDGEMVVAALACPELDAADGGPGSIYAAVRGRGAFSMPLDTPERRRPIHVSTVRRPSEGRFCESFESAHSSHSQAATLADMLGIAADPIRMDSQAKYAVVARGSAEIYLRLTKHSGYLENIWDHAAGALIIEEAGGKVTDLNGRRHDFRQGVRLERNVGIVATNGHLHDPVLRALEEVLVSS